MKASLIYSFLVCVINPFVLFSVLTLSVWSVAALSADHELKIQTLDSISEAVEQFISSQMRSDQKMDIAVKSLDHRLRLQHCDSDLESTWSQGTRKLGRVTVRVACSGPRPWRVNVQATVTTQSKVWTLARSVNRGEILAREMLVQEEVTLGKSNGALRTLGVPVSDIAPLMGFEFTQRVSNGNVLSESMLKPAKLISKGDAVIIRHRSPGLKLQTRGVALSDAGVNQQTQVRNSSTGKIIDVLAVSSGTVETLK